MQYIWLVGDTPYLCRPLTMKHGYGLFSEAVLQKKSSKKLKII